MKKLFFCVILLTLSNLGFAGSGSSKGGGGGGGSSYKAKELSPRALRKQRMKMKEMKKKMEMKVDELKEQARIEGSDSEKGKMLMKEAKMLEEKMGK